VEPEETSIAGNSKVTHNIVSSLLSAPRSHMRDVMVGILESGIFYVVRATFPWQLAARNNEATGRYCFICDPLQVFGAAIMHATMYEALNVVFSMRCAPRSCSCYALNNGEPNCPGV
jgi:hypothetical protein